MQLYHQMPRGIQVMLENQCREAGYSTSPNNLFEVITNTLKKHSPHVTSELLDISVSLVWMIKDEVSNEILLSH